MKMGFIWTGTHWDYGHHLNFIPVRGPGLWRDWNKLEWHFNVWQMFSWSSHSQLSAKVWEKNKSNDLLWKLNCLFCAKHIEIVRYIGLAQSPLLSIFTAQTRLRPPATAAWQPGTSGAQTRESGLIEKFDQIWVFRLKYGEIGAMNTVLSAVISCESSLSHLHTSLHSNYGWSSVFFVHSRFSTELKSTFQCLFPARLWKCVIFIVVGYNPWYFLTITVKAAFYLWCSARYELQKRPILFFPPRNFPRHQIQYEMELPFLLYIYRDWSIFHWDTFLQTFNKTLYICEGFFWALGEKYFHNIAIFISYLLDVCSAQLSPFSQNKKQ